MGRFTLVLGLAILAAGCGAREGARSAAVPWVDRPAPSYTAPPWKAPSAPRASAPPCTADQLCVAAVSDGAAAGSAVERFVFTNISSTVCRLGGRPGLTGVVDGRRRVLALRRPAAATFPGLIIPADLRPHGHGFFDWTFADACPARRTAHAVDFEMPGGGTVSTARAAPLFTCGRSAVSPLGRYAPAPRPPRAAPGTVDTLAVRLSLRHLQRIAAGHTLRYVVTLRNPTRFAVQLDPCPSYTEGLYTEGHPVLRRYRLNCNTVHRIAPHQGVRYAMRLMIPRVAGGLAKLAWSLNTPRTPAAVAVVMVAGPTSP